MFTFAQTHWLIQNREMSCYITFISFLSNTIGLHTRKNSFHTVFNQFSIDRQKQCINYSSFRGTIQWVKEEYSVLCGDSNFTAWTISPTATKVHVGQWVSQLLQSVQSVFLRNFHMVKHWNRKRGKIQHRPQHCIVTMDTTCLSFQEEKVEERHYEWEKGGDGRPYWGRRTAF